MAGLNLKMRSTSLNLRDMRVWLDGHEITTGLTGLTVSFDPVDVTMARLDVVIDALELDAETLAHLTAHVEAQDDARPEAA